MTEAERRVRIAENALSHIAHGLPGDPPPMRAKTCRAIASEALRLIEESRRIEREAAT